MSEPELPEARPDQLEVTVAWQDDDGALRGVVEVRNVSGTVCRLSNKPVVRPLDAAGAELDVQNVITLELRRPDHVVLEPGRRAQAPVRWSAWDGPSPGERVVVRWPGGELAAVVHGPSAPRHAGPGSLSSSWFRLLPEDSA